MKMLQPLLTYLGDRKYDRICIEVLGSNSVSKFLIKNFFFFLLNIYFRFNNILIIF